MAPLHSAAGLGDFAGVQRLLAAGVAVNQRDRSGDTALHDAARNGHAQIAQALLAAGADPEAGDKGRRTPLHIAVTNNHANVIRVLLNAGANANAADFEGKGLLHFAAASRSNKEVVRMLLKAGADPHAADAGVYRSVGLVGIRVCQTPLHVAAFYGNLDAIQELLAAGASPNSTTAGETPLHCGAQWGFQDVLEMLLHGGANPNAVNRFGQTAADVATARGDVKSAAMIQAVARFGAEAALRRRVLTVKGTRTSSETLELSCTTLAGNVAATVRWLDTAPLSSLPQAVIDAIKASGFKGLQEPVELCNLSLLKPGAGGQLLDCSDAAPSLCQQLGLTD